MGPVGCRSALWDGSGKVYKAVFCVVLMANGLLKKLGLAIAIAGSSLLGVRDAQATPVDWTSAYQNMFTDSQMVDYTTTLNFNGGVSDRNISLVYFLDCGNNNFAPVAGFNVLAGSNVANGKITRDDSEYYGLISGQTLNSGSAPNGYWDAVFDYNNNGKFGALEGMHILFHEFGEYLNNYSSFSIDVSGLPAFPIGDVPQSGGFINIHVSIPEPNSALLLALGAGALGLRRRRKRTPGDDNVYNMLNRSLSKSDFVSRPESYPPRH